MEILKYVLMLIGILCTSYVFGSLLTEVYIRFIKPKPVLLSIDDLKLPVILPCLSKYSVKRGVSVTDTLITMYWDAEHCSRRREYKRGDILFVTTFLKEWQAQEVAFYNDNHPLLTKVKKSKKDTSK